MRTKLWSLLLTVSILFGMEGISASRMPPVAAAEKTRHLDFFVQFIGQDTFLDLGAPGFSQGDEFILHDLVFTPDGRPYHGPEEFYRLRNEKRNYAGTLWR